MDSNNNFAEFLWRVYRRADPPQPWIDDGNLPWNEPVFSERMLREHLDESHDAASRTTPQRALQVAWLWNKLNLQIGNILLDITCGPGLYTVDMAQRGCRVTAIDFSPASIAYGRHLAEVAGVAELCHFVEQDVREMDYEGANFAAALFLYGQLAVFRREEAQTLLRQAAAALKPGGRLCVELLNQDKVDKKQSNWWFTDDKGLWGERPFLHLGERFWDEQKKLSIERFYTIDLRTAESYEINLCDQTYAADEMTQMMLDAGFHSVDVYHAWDGLGLYDADEWFVYVAEK